MTESTPIPTSWVGPIRVSGDAVSGEVSVPLATYESPLWPSVGRGARISRQVEGGIRVTVVDERMTRSILLRADDAATAVAAGRTIDGALVTELAVIAFPDGRATLQETAPGVSVQQVLDATEAELAVPQHVPQMSL